jgi:hypothetical protein
MAESELSVTYDDLMQEVATFLGYGSDSAAWTSSQRAECDRYVQSGVRRFYYPPAAEGVQAGYSWSFLKPTTTIDTVADDGAQDLPADLARVLGNFYYEEGQHRLSIPQVSEQQIQALLARQSSSTGSPQVARVRQKPKDAERGQRFEVAWWPVPDAAYTFTFRYEAYAGKLGADNPYPLGGMRHAELLIASCLAVAESKANDERGLHAAEFERLLRSAIEQDRRLSGDRFGYVGDPCEDSHRPRRGDTGGTYPITYNGVDVDA